ncbi:MAG: efflux RND transporter periplasmic adaptor subunit [candidate division Zixibacteria bacterium]|nr:efflux RND transporter periplasmic adaptor subunit [candidate division Zixibacteria bacterium]
MKKKVIIIGAVVVVVAVFAFLALKGSGGKKQSNNSVKVEIGSIIDKALAIGQIEPKNQISVKSKISGIVKKVFVEMGDSVKKGDRLVEIRPDPTPLEFAEAKRQVEIDSVNYENQKKEYLRTKELLAKKLVSQQDFDQASRGAGEAELRLKLSQERLSLIERGKTNIAGRKIESVIKASITGTVLERKINVGDPVVPLTSYQAGTELFTLADMNELIFRGTVDEIDVGKLKEGMTTLLKIGALPNDTIEGVLYKISPKAKKEENATLFDVEIKITQTGPSLLRAGYSANADIIIKKKEDILLIPERLVEFVEDTAFVQVKDSASGEIEKKTIETGLSDGLNIEVTEGLKEGDLLMEKPPKEIK